MQLLIFINRIVIIVEVTNEVHIFKIMICLKGNTKVLLEICHLFLSLHRMNNIFNKTTATCCVTNTPVGTSESLEVYFDGALIESTDLFTLFFHFVVE